MTDFDHHYKIQKNAGFRLGHSLISAFFCDLWILLFVQPIVSNRHIDLSDFSSAALSSIVVATATPHSSALQMKKSSCVNIADT